MRRWSVGEWGWTCGLVIYPSTLLIGTVSTVGRGGDRPSLAPEVATLGCALLMVCWWVTEAVPLPVTALLPLVLLPLTGVCPAGAVSAAYFSDAVLLFFASFLLAAAVEAHGLHTRVALWGLQRVGGRRAPPPRLLGCFIGTAAFLSMWLNNTATAALLVPLAEAVLDDDNVPRRRGRGLGGEGGGRTAEAAGKRAAGRRAAAWAAVRQGGAGGVGDEAAAAAVAGMGGAPAFSSSVEDEEDVDLPAGMGTAVMLGIAFGSSLGGMSTLTGTGPNLVLQGVLAAQAAAAAAATGQQRTTGGGGGGGSYGLGYGTWLAMVGPVAWTGVVLLWLILCAVYLRPPRRRPAAAAAACSEPGACSPLPCGAGVGDGNGGGIRRGRGSEVNAPCGRDKSEVFGWYVAESSPAIAAAAAAQGREEASNSGGPSFAAAAAAAAAQSLLGKRPFCWGSPAALRFLYGRRHRGGGGGGIVPPPHALPANPPVRDPAIRPLGATRKRQLRHPCHDRPAAAAAVHAAAPAPPLQPRLRVCSDDALFGAYLGAEAEARQQQQQQRAHDGGGVGGEGEGGEGRLRWGQAMPRTTKARTAAAAVATSALATRDESDGVKSENLNTSSNPGSDRNSGSGDGSGGSVVRSSSWASFSQSETERALGLAAAKLLPSAAAAVTAAAAVEAPATLTAAGRRHDDDARRRRLSHGLFRRRSDAAGRTPHSSPVRVLNVGGGGGEGGGGTPGDAHCHLGAIRRSRPRSHSEPGPPPPPPPPPSDQMGPPEIPGVDFGGVCGGGEHDGDAHAVSLGCDGAGWPTGEPMEGTPPPKPAAQATSKRPRPSYSPPSASTPLPPVPVVPAPLTWAQKVVVADFGCLVLAWFTRAPHAFPGWASLLPSPSYATDGTAAMAAALVLFLVPERGEETDAEGNASRTTPPAAAAAAISSPLHPRSSARSSSFPHASPLQGEPPVESCGGGGGGGGGGRDGGGGGGSGGDLEAGARQGKVADSPLQDDHGGRSSARKGGWERRRKWKGGRTVLRWDLVNSMPWDVIFLLGGGYALSVGFNESGLSEAIAAVILPGQAYGGGGGSSNGEGSVDGNNGSGGTEEDAVSSSRRRFASVVGGAVLLTCGLSNVVSNVATANLALPLLACVASRTGRHPWLLLVPATVACSLAFLLPVSTPPNAIAYGSGRVPVRDMVAVGGGLTLALLALLATATATTIPMALAALGEEDGGGAAAGDGGQESGRASSACTH